jgi:hypothetical protein
MKKLLVGGALGALLIAGQAIASRLPEAPAAPVVAPVAVKVAAAPVAEPTLARAAVVTDRLDLISSADPVAGVDPAASGVSPAGDLTEAETARLAARQVTDLSSLCSIFAGFLPSTCGVYSQANTQTEANFNPYVIPTIAIGVITTTAIVVATDDDSDS